MAENANRKYELTDETLRLPDGTTLRRIRAVRDFETPLNAVRAGQRGGFVQSESNLDHDRGAWVRNDAAVFGDARVWGEAQVSGDAMVGGNAQVFCFAQVGINACVGGNALIGGFARVCGNARVSGFARIDGRAFVGGDALVGGDAEVNGRTFLASGRAFGTMTPAVRHGADELRSVAVQSDALADGGVTIRQPD